MTFYFDVISPYAYLAWTQIHAVAGERPVRPVPILFAGLLNHHGQKGPAEIPSKKAYVFKDVLRLAAGFGVPLRPPPTHPFNPLLALRVAGLEMEACTRRALIDALFHAVWGEGSGVTDEQVVGGLAADCGVPDAVERATSPEAKARLRSSTEQAIAEGVFGVPTAVVDGELFWGCDGLGHLRRFLAGNDPIDAALVAQWVGLASGVER